MNETMNLNGMGIGGNAEVATNNVVAASVPVEKNKVDGRIDGIDSLNTASIVIREVRNIFHPYISFAVNC